MASKILSFICHVPATLSDAYSAAPTSTSRTTDRKTGPKSAGGHFTAIYENERFVRFKYINNPN